MMMIKRCDDDTNNEDNAASDPNKIEMLERSIRTQRETKAPFELRCFLQSPLPPTKALKRKMRIDQRARKSHSRSTQTR